MPGDKDILETTMEDGERENTELEEFEEAEDVEEVEEFREELAKENARLVQQLTRLKADFENFRRRTKGQMETIVLEANEELLLDLLPVLDNFERALASQAQNTEEEDPLLQGMEMVYQGLLATLAKYGLKAIVAEGEPFNPYFHEAISMEGDGGDDLVVVQQIQTGYLLNDKVIRHTRVLVGQNKEEDECQK